VKLIAYNASFHFVSIPLKGNDWLLGDTHTAGMDDPVNSHLAGFANAFRVGGRTIIVYCYCNCLLQTFSKVLTLINCVCTFAMMIDNPPSTNSTVYGKLLDVVIHLADSVGKRSQLFINMQ
jgi:hypothetical protein